ncbi:MAG: NADH-quinone oxidoreductase subunit J family protein [Tepidiformaceae bacterium]
MATEVLWWIFAAAITGVSIGVVSARTVIHSAIFLILSLAGVGAMYVFLTVEFLALVQFLIYGGAVTVLILLALMLTRGGGSAVDRLNGPQAPFAMLVGGALLAVLIGAFVTTEWPGNPAAMPPPITITPISRALFIDFGAPFIIASAVLLVALVGAIILARQEDE